MQSAIKGRRLLFEFFLSHLRSSWGNKGSGRICRKIWSALVVCWIAPASRCVANGYGRQAVGDWGLVPRGDQRRKEAEGNIARETRRSNLRRISQAKGERVRRTWVPTTSLMTARSALSLGLVVGSPALSNKRLRCKARTLRL